MHASRTQFVELSRLTYDVVQSSRIVAAGRVRPLVYVCAVDVTGSDEHIELVKAALLAMTRAQSLNLGPKVRVNAVCPGPILKPPDYSEERWQSLRNTNPLHELGSAEQVAETVIFLATGPQFINGDCIMLDGGRLWQHQ